MRTVPLRAAVAGLLMTPLLISTSAPSAQASPAPGLIIKDGNDVSTQREPVELLGAATETAHYWRHPDGHITTELWARPVRVKQKGVWTWIDTALAPSGDRNKTQGHQG
jgi:hypothetical protein